jgi:Mg2+ and Co2+ transporter CorA
VSITVKDTSSWLRRVSVWPPEGGPRQVEIDELHDAEGFPWFELSCGASEVATVLEVVGDRCPGLTAEMLEDLLTPDDEPAGRAYSNSQVRLASSFSVSPERPEEKAERGTPQRAGILIFQPVELLVGEEWIITCWHPSRAFRGPRKVAEGPAEDATALYLAVAGHWERGKRGSPGDLGVSIMHELALTYVPAQRELSTWLEDWELSLYIKDELDNQNELPELWGLMAVLRNWLGPLNRPGLRASIDKAWLPATDHNAVIDVDNRVDKALAGLGRLSETLRQSFSLLHLEQTEEERRHSERMQQRLELAAVVFLVPTLIVGFYGANTWVPGQGRHWGFWVMVAALVLLSLSSLFVVAQLHRRSNEASRSAAAERRRLRHELQRDPAG